MIYIHVPFCRKRCIYCDFYSTTQGEETRAKFVEALCKEIETRVDYLPSRRTGTIYFGGGTPSQLSLSEVEKVMNTIRQYFQVSDDAEVTFEANPDDISPEKVAALKAIGVNRISLGVQSFDDHVLRTLNRRHDSAEAVRAIETIADEGVGNISIDLIYGLPGQTLEMFQGDLAQAFALPITHLSSYALSVETGTVLAQKVKNGVFSLPDEDVCAAEYNALLDAAECHGFEHYEISNFSLPGLASRHNSGYWNGTPYAGFGPGAHSFDGCDRRYNLPDLQAYIYSQGFDVQHTNEHLTESERYDELVFTSLRTQKGLDVKKVLQQFGSVRQAYLLENAAPHIRRKSLVLVNNHLRLSRQALFVSDGIISDLMAEV